ncbi:MAG TPA: RimK family alpha-L-glutamate ligase [archaeon]|nr:RimK family alpha-L-glutamate ligase [archaeon]
MKILVIYGRELDRNSAQLVEAFRKIGHKPISASIMNLSAYIRPGGHKFFIKGRELVKPDICFLRSLGPGTHEQINRRINVIEHLEFSGCYVINSANAFRRARDKYATMYVLAKAGLPVPKTLVTESSLQAYKFAKKLGEFVCKPMIGSMGYGSMKFNNADLAYNAFRLLERINQPIYVQEYFPTLRDFRAFVIGNKLLAAISRAAPPEEWKTNIAQGGKAEAVQLSSKMVAMAANATKALGLEYAGVDFIESERGPIILEVNSSPSWQALQSATKLNVAEKLALHAVSKVGRLK